MNHPRSVARSLRHLAACWFAASALPVSGDVITEHVVFIGEQILIGTAPGEGYFGITAPTEYLTNKIFEVGWGEPGVLEVKDGGVLTVLSPGITSGVWIGGGDEGTFRVSNGTAWIGWLCVGAGVGDGFMEVGPGGSVTTGSALDLGGPLASGTLRIHGGGMVTTPYLNMELVEKSATLILDGGTLNTLNGLFHVDGNFRVILESGGGTLLIHTDASTHVEIEGEGGLTVSSGGTLTLTGENTYTGGTKVLYGNLSIGDGGTTGSIVGDVESARDLIFHRSDDVTFAGNITTTDIGRLVKRGAGKLTLTGNNSFSRGIAIEGGELAMTGNNHFKKGLEWTSHTLTLSGSNTFDEPVKLSGGRLEVASNGALGNGVPLVLAGGELRATGGARTLGHTVLIEQNTTFSGSNLTLAGNVTLANDRKLTIANAVTKISGVIDGAHSLSKDGEGELELTAANTYTGGTVVSGGSVRINNTSGSAFGTGGVVVEAGATLTGSGSFTGALQLGGVLSPGNSPGTLSAGDTTWLGGGTYVWEINNATGVAGANWDLLSVDGTLSLAGPGVDNPFTIEVHSLTAGNVAGDAENFDPARSYTWILVTTTAGISGFDEGKFLIDASGFANAPDASRFSLSSDGMNLTLTYSAVPEPATWGAVLGIGLLALALRRRRWQTTAEGSPER